jgi:hypothetical protein
MDLQNVNVESKSGACLERGAALFRAQKKGLEAAGAVVTRVRRQWWLAASVVRPAILRIN